jgi:hypothetical protein
VNIEYGWKNEEHEARTRRGPSDLLYWQKAVCAGGGIRPSLWGPQKEDRL